MITARRTTRPIVSIVATAASEALASRVERTVEKTAIVVRAPTSAADASILVGDALPSPLGAVTSPVFAVLGDRSDASVSIAALRAPAWTPLDARVPVTIDAHAVHARGRTVDVELRDGDLVVDRSSHTVATDDEHVPVTLGFVPTATGAASLTVAARVGGARASANAVVDVRDQRWAVLFFDARPSWMSTFARRALESDSRFVVTSRVVTSRNVSVDAGTPPRLDDLSALALYDAVVVGAPEALAPDDVAALEAFMRRRGGSVILLLDRRAGGPPDRLLQVAAWSADSGKAATIALVGQDSGMLKSSEIAWPTRLPDGADVLARAGARPIVWRSSVGAGQLIVSGALDAWRFRDPTVSGFDRVWQSLIADAAASAPPSIDIALAHAALAPGEETDVAVTIRDASLAAMRPLRTAVSATLETDGEPPVPVRLWPSGTVGEFRGTVRGGSSGVHRLVVASGGARMAMPIAVAAGSGQPSPDASDVATAFANTHGGRAIAASEIGSLPSLLRDAIRPAPRVESVHPMRSAWWIVPFVLALSGEWWLRRRRGLP
jgi:hypothetical protein